MILKAYGVEPCRWPARPGLAGLDSVIRGISFEYELNRRERRRGRPPGEGRPVDSLIMGMTNANSLEDWGYGSDLAKHIRSRWEKEGSDEEQALPKYGIDSFMLLGSRRGGIK